MHAIDPTLWTADPKGQDEVKIRLGWLGPRVDVDMHGGKLTVEWAGGANDSVFLTGPAATVFEGEIDL